MNQVGYIRINTPLEDHLSTFGLLVKREDLSCAPPGPPFSKTRGVLPHVKSAMERGMKTIGVLDTSHSQGGQAVAQACESLGLKCLNFFPVYKADKHLEASAADVANGDALIDAGGKKYHLQLKPQQLASSRMGAHLIGLDAGRSAVLYHQAKRATETAGGYMMPNALKLPETVTETAAEVCRTIENADQAAYRTLRDTPWIVSASSATIAAGVFVGLRRMYEKPPKIFIHMGYSRSIDAVINYLVKMTAPHSMAISEFDFQIIDEGYEYKDQARNGPDPEWPCNPYYDLKAFRWWMESAMRKRGETAVLWNVG